MILVIGYGNTLRSDDAAGQIVAREVEKKKWENVRSLAVHQLTPELATDLSSCELAIFVDAYVAKDNEGVDVRQLSITDEFLTKESPSSFGHTGDGRSLLVLCQALYNRVPEAYWVLVPAINFQFGEQQSPVTERGIVEAVLRLEQLIKNWVARHGNLVKSVKLPEQSLLISMKARDIMTEDVVKIRGSATVAEAIALMRDNTLRGVIVDRRHEEDAYGIVTEKDIVYKVAAFGKDPKRMRVYEIMSKPCIVVNPDLAVEYVARLFARTGLRMAPVISNTLLGVVSLTDILTRSDFVEQPKETVLEQEIAKAVQEARDICTAKGTSSPECAAAWDIVEELQAEAAHQRAKTIQKTAFEEYCEEFPEAAEAREYDT